MKKLTLSLLTTALMSTTHAASADDHGTTIETRWADIEVETVASGLVRPWGISFMPDGRMLVTELPGRIRIVESDGTLGEPLAGLPEVKVRNQGGLLDVVLAPDFETSQRIYISYSEPESPGSTITSTAVAHARIVGNELQDFTRVFSGEPKVEGGRHYGGRMTFSDDGQYLFLGLGDRGHQMMQAQELDSHTGTIIRIHANGSIPSDNPFVNDADAQSEIWSYGHRNVQGIDIQPSTGTMWSVEHGPQGGDEINHPMAGHNYGWPLITYGEEYGGGELAVSQGTHKDGLEQPIWHWTPSIAVSGMTFYQGDVFPQWQGNILAGALRGQQIARMEIEDGRVMHYEPIAMDYRIRQVAVGPQGYVYALTDERENAKILRLSPKAE
ncbi:MULTISPECIES: PQQ-dependent sugar dehydrogenase [Gammaproteobacteria]|uniref:PQQ-dependent sugar dehydrogenase n=1 Tax=Gammaproteobacteria TaxID=1236 RepID=UPI000DD05F7B|nr:MULTISPECIES: PQQ-dependent sugar dehydrogenase [Gammaproteobacteria]RTE86754.1 PQQ-dependent sugar dehydrogenase [Aliidiomarina sp. B3213]TCZ90692.1 PQQ-dependent sugar dehydrogenase [Lysobacter sp. N42]